jgi:DNA-binding transcriptional LysR family regulator
MDWTHRLRLRNLQMLISLAHTRNISQSAAILNTTQPGLSKWLKDLEDDIGLQLFERHARGLRLTPYGEALIAHAKRIEVQLDRAQGEMAVLRAGGSGQVAIGTSGASAPGTVPHAVLMLVKRMPQVRVRLVESMLDTLLEQLARGELDLVVGRSAPEYLDPVITTERLYRESIHFIARPGHPLFDLPEVTWDDIEAYPWITWPKGTPIRNALESSLAEAGRAPRGDYIESGSATFNVTLLLHSDMISAASHGAAIRHMTLKNLRIIPLRLAGQGSVSMYWRNDPFLPSAVKEALTCVRLAAKEHGENPV